MTASRFSLLLGSILALAPLAALADDGAPVDSDRVLHRLPLSAEGWTLAGEIPATLAMLRQLQRGCPMRG